MQHFGCPKTGGMGGRKLRVGTTRQASVAFGIGADRVEISGSSSHVNEILEDHMAADRMRRQRGQREDAQVLVMFRGRWNLADHVGTFTFWPAEADPLTTAGYETQGDGRVIAKAWCRHDLSIICLVGAEEHLSALPAVT